MFALNRIKVFVIILIVLFLAATDSCSSASSETRVPGRDTFTQVSTINALIDGVYDGDVTCGQLKTYGDFGLGTVQAVDGEMVELNGQIYQVKTDGVAYAAPDSLEIPFAEVTFFQDEQDENIPAGTDYAGLEKILDKIIPANTFAAIKITGEFSYMQTRAVPKQVKPYPPLTAVTKQQAVFEFHNVSGTIVGFRCPQYVNGINVPGYHLHFLTSDNKAGGHVLAFQTDSLTASLDYLPDFFMMLPDRSSDFYKLDLSGNQQDNIQQVEK